MNEQLSEFLDKVIGFVKSHSAASIEPVTRRLADIEAKVATKGERGEPGQRGDDGAPGKDGRDGRDGKDVDLELVNLMVRQAAADLPTAKDGAPGRDGVDGKNGAPGRDGVDGKDGKDGKDGAPGERGEKGADGINGKDGAPGERGEKGADGINGKDGASVDMQQVADLVAKALHLATPDIVAKAAALIPVPANGRDGRDGAAGAPGQRGEKGADGAHGRDGVDGFSADDFQLSVDGRLLTVSMACGARTVQRQVTLGGMPIYQGVYKGERLYVADDMVTYGGGIWRAKRDTTEPPKGPNDDWQLVVKGGK